MKIAVIPNTGKDGAKLLAESIVKTFPSNCFSVKDYLCEGDFDAAVVLGGDGTMLRAVKSLRNIPVIGINFGTLGYMAAAEKENALLAVKKVLEGNI